MAELARQIEEKDIPRVKKTLANAGFPDSYKDIARLGGMTNHSYKITLDDGMELLVRIPGEGTEKLINRLDERKSTELACKLGIDSKLYYFDDTGNKVMAFIPHPRHMDEAVMARKEVLTQAAELFHRLHCSGVDTGVKFEVFEMAALYEKIIRDEGVLFPGDYDWVKQAVMDIKDGIDKDGKAPRVPCHNDSLVGNWVLDGDGRLYLIDWEYSGMNEAMWDLSCLSIEMNYSGQDDDFLLSTYYAHENKCPGAEEKRRFVAAKMYVDYLWTLWGLTRVPFDGAFMQEYADGRYSRLKRNIEVCKTLA